MRSISLPPNQRPENCLRFCRAFLKSSTFFFHEHFEIDSRVLILGDGDFSFSLCVAEYSHCNHMPGRVTVTSFESMESVLSIYPTGGSNLQRLQELNITVEHNIDAANAGVLGCAIQPAAPSTTWRTADNDGNPSVGGVKLGCVWQCVLAGVCVGL